VGPKHGLDGWGKSHHPPGFDPRTVKPVASLYTDWAIPVHTVVSVKYVIIKSIRIDGLLLLLRNI
jgi:hypothetical protein